MNFPIHGFNIPAREISGDFYDFYPHNDRIYFTLCDVSGKGVNAGMVMARAITLFKIYSKNKFKPNEILFEMNNDLQQTNPKGVYVTSIIGCYNSKTDTVELSNVDIFQHYLELTINLQNIIHLLYLLELNKQIIVTIINLKVLN